MAAFRVTGIAGSVLFWCLKCAAQPTFTGVGDLPGGIFQSSLTRISADGTTAVGTSSGSFYRAVRWRSGSGLQDLGALTGGQSDAYGVSGDGEVVAATCTPPALCRWSSVGGWQNLGTLPGGTSFGVVYDVSDNGTVCTGMADSPNGNRAFRWTQATGMVSLGVPPGATASIALSISGDGSTVVGGGGVNAGYRWTQAGGWQSLGHLPGGPGTNVDATAVAFAGDIIVGASDSATGVQAFRWTQATGMIGLGDLPGGAVASRALGVSDDGSVIVGRGITGLGPEAFYWTAGTGMVNLRSLLLSWGLSQVSGWQLRWATDVSADGRVIVGSGIDPLGNEQGWVVTIPAPAGLLPVSAAFTLMVGRRRRERR